MEHGFRTPLFADMALAERIERAEVQLIFAVVEATRRRTGGREFAIGIAGGVASYGGRGSPFTKIAGLGFGGVPAQADLQRLEGAYAEVESEFQVEVSSLADPQVLAALADRGYALRSFENVLGRDLSVVPEMPKPAAVEVSVSAEDEFDDWLDVVVEGVMHPDEQGVPGEQFDRQSVVDAERDLAATGVRRYLARLNGVVAGGAGLRVVDGIAEFAGAATAPAYRRRGVQSALLSARLADAAAAGCDVAVITTQPGSKSQENAQRRGFELLYTRAVLVRA
jgi:ribosomal protein S18 acetylase RimI-like enzyme